MKANGLEIQITEIYNRYFSRKECFLFTLGLVIYLTYLSEFKCFLFNTTKCLAKT